ncbi:ABC transporter permease [Corynebacterium yudongzhengii]|uniref:ABC transporter permease n=1 Tax=Corynebacterium yudongzhengii TaxID=2080740 RepID=A0A2U1T7P2_9CORY|nr:ABC transporter permease [Corynebacterium yudongzhengii]AWB82364.1 ABC transporter permease [Corynebacterium yudongzhengii]PWC02017.1 ABC transporter permease [Corynebacterium yudongzhengii]
MSYSSGYAITTVAKREIQVGVKNRGIMISMALTLILVLGGIFAAAYFVDRDEEAAGEPPAVATTEPAVLEGMDYEVIEVADRGAGTQAVAEGDAEAALIGGDSGWELFSDGSPSTSIVEAIGAAVQSFETQRALGALGIDPAQYAAEVGDTTVTPVDVSGDEDEEMNPSTFFTLLVSLAGIFVMLFAIILFAANIGSRVTEEKSSRVVELILASVRPMDFLTGKILGNVIFGLVWTLIIVFLAVGALMISGLLEGFEFDWTVLPLMLLGFLIGLIFFGSLYAAAGAMVQRTEDLQSTQGPIMILVFTTMYVPLFGWSQLDATWMQVMGWVPPISTMTAPLQYAAGNMSLWEVLGSFAIMVVVTLAAIWLVARIYRAAILNNGQKMSWLKAVRATPA